MPARRLSLFEYLIDTPSVLGQHQLTATASDHSGLVTMSSPVSFVVKTEAVSREVSLFNFGPSEVLEAVSREASVYNFGPSEPPEAVSLAPLWETYHPNKRNNSDSPTYQNKL